MVRGGGGRERGRTVEGLGRITVRVSRMMTKINVSVDLDLPHFQPYKEPHEIKTIIQYT